MVTITNKAIEIVGSDYQAPTKTYKFLKPWKHTFTLANWEEKPVEFEEEFYKGFIERINQEKQEHPSLVFLQRNSYNNWRNHVYQDIPLQLDIREEDGEITINYQVYVEISAEDLFNR